MNATEFAAAHPQEYEAFKRGVLYAWRVASAGNPLFTDETSLLQQFQAQCEPEVE